MDDKPLDNLAATERKLDEKPPAPELAPTVVETEHLGAAQRLRAFEDEAFGPDAVRIGGQIERGSGSLFQNPTIMPAARHRQYAALERLVEAEQRLTVATGDLAAAQAAYDQSAADVETAADAAKPKGEA